MLHVDAIDRMRYKGLERTACTLHSIYRCILRRNVIPERSLNIARDIVDLRRCVTALTSDFKLAAEQYRRDDFARSIMSPAVSPLS